jgi:hypothetical protein
MSYPLAKRLEEWRREDREMNDEPQPGEWKTCYHKSIGALGICRDCGQRAAIKLEELEKREPMNGQITLAVEAFESACDAAIEAIGGGAAGTIFMQRRARFDLIRDREFSYSAAQEGEKLFTRGVDPELVRLNATARDARERLEEERASR